VSQRGLAIYIKTYLNPKEEIMETPVQFCYLKKIENLVSVPNPVLKIRPRSSLVFANWNQKLWF
jgi:hypothetical protein